MIGRPLISIAMCTYNGEKYLSEQLDSLIRQDYDNIEIVIIDDCSTDGTVSILQEFRHRSNRIKIYENRENKGFNRNFEYAISLCDGAYIAIADQDDIWENNKITTLFTNLKDDLLIYHDSRIIDEKGTYTGKKISDGHRFVKGQCEHFLLYNNSISGHSILFNQDLRPYILPFPPGIYYDWWIAYTAACLGRIGFVEHSLVNHRRHGLNSTTQESETGREQRIRNLMLFGEHPLTTASTNKLISSLLSAYQVLQNNLFSSSLLTLLLENQRHLFYTRRKSFFSKVKFILKESFGHRMAR